MYRDANYNFVTLHYATVDSIPRVRITFTLHYITRFFVSNNLAEISCKKNCEMRDRERNAICYVMDIVERACTGGGNGKRKKISCSRRARLCDAALHNLFAPDE